MNLAIQLFLFSVYILGVWASSTSSDSSDSIEYSKEWSLDITGFGNLNITEASIKELGSNEAPTKLPIRSISRKKWTSKAKGKNSNSNPNSKKITLIDLTVEDDKKDKKVKEKEFVLDKSLCLNPKYTEISLNDIIKKSYNIEEFLSKYNENDNLLLPKLGNELALRSVKVRDMNSLLSLKGNVNDDIINAYMMQLTKYPSKTTRYFAIDSSWIDPSRRVGAKDFQFESGTTYLWPLFHENKQHWTLLVFEISKERKGGLRHYSLTHYDYLNLEITNDGLDGILTALAFINEKTRLMFTRRDISVKRYTGMGSQLGCGAFTLIIARSFVVEDNIYLDGAFDADNFKAQINIELTLGIIFKNSDERTKKEIIKLNRRY